jgi:hypothetical protein
MSYWEEPEAETEKEHAGLYKKQDDLSASPTSAFIIDEDLEEGRS